MAAAKRSRRKATQHANINWPWVAFVVVVSTVAIVFIVLLGNSKASLADDPSAPEFSGSTLDKSRVSLRDFRGKVVMLNFWATWCPPCRAEMPILEDAFEKYGKRGFTILAINNGESAETVQAFAAQHGLTFPVILDPARTIQRQFQMDSYPTSLFVDPNGRLYDSHLGAVTPDSLASAIETGLARVGR